MIARLKPQEMLNPLRVDNKFYLLRLKERKEPFTPEYTIVRDQARAMLIAETAKQAAKEKTESCLEKMREISQDNPAAVNFSASAAGCGLKYGSTESFKYGSYIEGIGSSDNFWLAAEKLKDGESSGIIETPAGFFIIRSKSKTTPDENKFEAEVEEFRGKLLLQKQQEAFADFFGKLEKESSLY